VGRWINENGTSQGAAIMDETTLRRLLNAALVTGSFLEPPPQAPGPETGVLLDALAALPPRGRAVVVLRYWANLSVDQVAAVLGCSTNTVDGHDARALDKLRAVKIGVMTESGPPSGLTGNRS
jgi:DNA-directed RNA polymerase specialized sigma24 family protein